MRFKLLTRNVWRIYYAKEGKFYYYTKIYGFVEESEAIAKGYKFLEYDYHGWAYRRMVKLSTIYPLYQMDVIKVAVRND